MDATDRRKHVRVILPSATRGSLNLASGVRVFNLSPEGALIEHAARLSPGETCVLGLTSAGEELRLRSHVAWTQVYGGRRTGDGERELVFRSGLAFADMPKEVAASLRDYVALLSDPDPGPTVEDPLATARGEAQSDGPKWDD